MGWKTYKLIYKAKSLIHIGWHTLGYVKLTRYYITGRAMWGAITANLARSIGNPGIESYKEIGEQVFPSYFYLAINCDTPMLPQYTKTGLEYGDYTKSEFERLFINSYGQTAVMPDSNTAEDNSLHESEYISPVVNINGSQQPVYFVGYIFLNDNAEYNGKIDFVRMKDALSEIFIGGDRKYGWGRLKLLKTDRTEKMFSYDINESLIIKIPQNNPVPAHLKANEDLNLKGDIEPLVGREWGERIVNEEDKKSSIHKGFGRKITKAEICWMPGSILDKDEDLTIQSYGILSR